MKPLCLAPLAILLLFPLAVQADSAKPTKDRVYQVPYRLTDSLHVLVRAKINGKGPFNFILDTGAPMLFVATEVGKQIGIQGDKNGWATLDRFEVEGGVVLRKVKARIETPFQLEGMNGLNLAGVPLHGIIGYSVLARFRLEFDFTKHEMGWTALDFNPPAPLGIMEKGGGAPGGLDSLGTILKLVGMFLGKRPQPKLVYRGFLGIELADMDGQVAVKAVLPGSPADRAGLQAGDRITAFEGRAVASADDLRRLSAMHSAGKAAQLRIRRGGDTREVSVEFGEGI
jgi:hypothetical protein